MKSIDNYFTDWEGDTFGYGYGTGEEHVLKALKEFLEAIPETGSYRYEALEELLTPTVAWLLINVLANGSVDVIEYGTSPRFGWLTPKGKALAAYVASHSLDQLVELTSHTEEYIPCYRGHCNCDNGDCTTTNPFWVDRPAHQPGASHD